jgi:gliding motility-associated-like protein
LDQCPDTPEGEEVDENGCAPSQKDSDNDGVTDDLDQCPDTPEGADVDENGCTEEQKIDTDQDGVPDYLDQCPDTPEGEEVDENGCAPSQKDSDNDGVTDDLDQCPDTPEGEEVDENGCALSEKDSDNDGVTDDLDQCPDTPDGEEVDEFGCAVSQIDTDNDGVPDVLDQCPDTPEGEEVDENGCAPSQKDTDGDGVTDDLDLCPETPEGEEVDEDGCALSQKDTDNDGVTDDKDLCPNTPEGEEVDEYGCSVNEIEPTIVVDFIDQDMIEVPWGTPFDATGLPTVITVITENGDEFQFPIIWNQEGYDPYQSGPYQVTGTIQLPNSWEWIEGFDRVPTIIILVLPKDPPLDLLLSNDFFNQNNVNTPILIGDFTVIDPTDDVHILELEAGVADNDLFTIIDGQLYWNNSNLSPGRNEFTIIVTVIDRAGNIFQKEFLITRRLEELLNEMVIPNTFTPDGDGINDNWGVPILELYNSIRIHVYERGGLRVFYTEDPNQRWNGTYLGKTLPVDTYYYLIEVDDSKETRKGILNLLRKN